MPMLPQISAPNLRYTLATPLVRRNYPKSIMKLAMPVDFNKVSDSQSFKIEEELLKNSQPNLLLANTELIKYSMENIFNVSRNVLVDSHSRDVVGSYIYEKFARYGLMATTHDFLHLGSYQQ